MPLSFLIQYLSHFFFSPFSFAYQYEYAYNRDEPFALERTHIYRYVKAYIIVTKKNRDRSA